MTGWTDPAFLAEAHAWIRQHVEPAGEIDQPHVQAWATALRVPTADGIVWFKASAAEVAHEGPLVELLAARRPDVVPPPIAVDRERGWMLSRHGGERLRDVVERRRDFSPWLDVLAAYGELQRAAAADVDAFLAAGVPDRRLATLPSLHRRLVEQVDVDDETRERFAAAPVDRLCEELAAHAIAETIQHDDLHDAQVYVGEDGSYRILDWGDAVVSHPFLTLAVTLDGVIQWGPDDVERSVDVEPFQRAYLRAWGDPHELAPAARAARRLGWLLRVQSGVDDPGQAGATVARLSMLLDGRA